MFIASNRWHRQARTAERTSRLVFPQYSHWQSRLSVKHARKYKKYYSLCSHAADNCGPPTLPEYDKTQIEEFFARWQPKRLLTVE